MTSNEKASKDILKRRMKRPPKGVFSAWYHEARMQRLVDARRKRRWLTIARKAVAAGEENALSHFTYTATNGYSYKAHGEIVTPADKTVNAAVRKSLEKLTPGIPVCSEEGGDITENALADAELAWALDPIDGTTNFTARLPLWGISLALLSHGEPLIGFISLPALRQRYHAIRGEGSFMGTHRLHVSKTSKLHESLGLLCYGYLDSQIGKGLQMINRFSKRVRSERVLGAAVVEATWVASGRADFSILEGVHVWDVAAGTLIVREAGGSVLNGTGKEWGLGDHEVIFSNKTLAKTVLSMYRKTA